MMAYYGLPYAELERMGYMIPVLELSEKFTESLKFGEVVKVVPDIYKVSAYKFYISYKIYDEGMKTVKHTATTAHCFLNNDFKTGQSEKKKHRNYMTSCC